MANDWQFPPFSPPPLEEGTQRYVLLDGAQCEQPLQLLRALPWAPLPLFDGLLADGTDDAAQRLERVLWNDPATGVMRHADAGYSDALECAREQGLNLPGIL